MPIDFSSSSRDDVLLYSPMLGRLYYLMGLPKGDMQNKGYSVKIPTEWILDDNYKREFLSCLMDTTLNITKSSIQIKKGSNIDDKSALTKYMTIVADMLSDFGIALTNKAVSIYTGNGGNSKNENYKHLVGKVNILASKKNVQKIISNLNIQFPTKKEILEKKLETYK